MRILTKGGSIPGVQHDEVEWTQSANIKDYDIVILNLDSIIEKPGGLATPDSSIPQSVEFPPAEDIVKLLRAGNILYIFLPRTRHISLIRVEDSESSQEEVDLLSWLPFEIGTTEESGVSVDKGSVHSYWQWYFNEDFDWPMYISSVSLKDNTLYNQSSFDSASQNSIAQTTFKEDIASELSILSASDIAVLLNEDAEQKYTGAVCLLPLKPDYNFDQAASELLSKVHGFSVEPSSVPSWAKDKRLPKQKYLIKRSQELKEEFKRLNRFNKLLYEDGEELENIVLNAFEEIGFETKPEISGKRDGAVILDDKVFILEIHGTENAIGIRKVDQLDRWVRNADEDFEDRELEGLLVANAYRRQEPTERKQSIVGDPEKHLEEYGYKILTTTRLYGFIRKIQQERISKEDVEEKLKETDTLIR